MVAGEPVAGAITADMYSDELLVRSEAKTRARQKIKGRKATKIKTSPGRRAGSGAGIFRGKVLQE